jgi:hypothetical protein
MKKLTEMTEKEILEQLNPNGYNFWEVAEGAAHSARDNKDIVVKEVKHKGGEGQGEEYYYVYEVTNTSDSTDVIFIKFDGYYTSDYGTDWDSENYKLVTPTSVTRIEYL